MKTLVITLSLHACALFGNAFRIGHSGLNNAARAPPSTLKTTLSVDQRGQFGAGAIRSPSSLKMAEETSDSMAGQHERRSFIQNVAQSVVLSSATVLSGSTSASAEINDASPKITDKVYFDVRISRADGSFYVRDPSPTDSPDDEPVYGRLVLGLFGEEAPEHVKRFLSYVDVPFDLDRPLPSYSRSKFQMLDTASGLLIGGTIPGLSITTLGGGNVLEYSGKVYPAKMWLEGKSDQPKLLHGAKGLLTHRNLDVTPSFGITTRSSTSALDVSHTIFGCIIEDQSGFLSKVVDLPVLTDTGRVSRTANEQVSMAGGGAGGAIASSVFTAQRAIFRDAAKTFGDTRLDKVYDGKLLRRIEVTKVGML